MTVCVGGICTLMFIFTRLFSRFFAASKVLSGDEKHVLMQEKVHVQEHSVECNAIRCNSDGPHYEQESAHFSCSEDDRVDQLNISMLSSCCFVDLEDVNPYGTEGTRPPIFRLEGTPMTMSSIIIRRVN
jgi:hypothetical protein